MNRITHSVATTSVAALLAAIGAVLVLQGCGAGGGNEAPAGPTTYQMGGARQGAALSLGAAVTTIAGRAGTSGFNDGTGAAARFYYPQGLATDGANLYVADYANHVIRRIVIGTGAVTTLAGTPGAPGNVDGTGSAARFRFPAGLTTDGTSLYVVDRGNHSIRKIALATGAVTTVAGTTLAGSADGVGAAARFNFPTGITTDGASLYVADTNNHSIRKIALANGEVTTLAGATFPGSHDGVGSAARFNFPLDLTTDGTHLYVADTDNHTIRKLMIRTGEVTTLAGSGGSPGSADGVGAAARFAFPSALTTDGTNLYVADSNNYTVRKVVIGTQGVTTLAGTPGASGFSDGTGATARFNPYPSGLTTDGQRLFVNDSANHTVRALQ